MRGKHPQRGATEDDGRKKDAWDKAQIISGFVASVVIAAVGLLINSSIQNAQIASAEKNTQAQIAVADRNAKAQLETRSGKCTGAGAYPGKHAHRTASGAPLQ
jgi:hypothetical protein